MSYQHILKRLPPEHAEAVTEIIETARDPYRTIFLACCKRIHVLGTGGVLGTGQGRAMSLPVVGLWVDAELKGQSRIAGQVMPTWYSVLFHEIGHSVDYITRPYRATELNAAIRQDVRNTLERLTTEIDVDQAPRIVERMMRGPRKQNDEQMLEWMKRVREQFVKEMNSVKGTGTERRLMGYSTSGVSDVYGGVTGNQCMELHHHPLFYWSWIMRSIGISPAMEFFADTFSDGMLGYEARIKLQETYLPTANRMITGGPGQDHDGAIWKVYDRIVKR